MGRTNHIAASCPQARLPSIQDDKRQCRAFAGSAVRDVIQMGRSPMIKIPYKVPTLALSLGAALICAAPGSPMAGAAVDLSTAVTSPSGTIFVIPSGNCFVQEGGAPFNVAIGITHNGSGSCITGTGGCTDVDSFALTRHSRVRRGYPKLQRRQFLSERRAVDPRRCGASLVHWRRGYVCSESLCRSQPFRGRHRRCLLGDKCERGGVGGECRVRGTASARQPLHEGSCD
jgi:hypothetical protein